MNRTVFNTLASMLIVIIAELLLVIIVNSTHMHEYHA